jgi:hypothetical protein
LIFIYSRKKGFIASLEVEVVVGDWVVVGEEVAEKENKSRFIY